MRERSSFKMDIVAIIVARRRLTSRFLWNGRQGAHSKLHQLGQTIIFPLHYQQVSALYQTKSIFKDRAHYFPNIAFPYNLLRSM